MELARLTVRQYRLAVADLVGSFRGNPNWGTERGLKGEYYSGRNFRDSRAVMRAAFAPDIQAGDFSTVDTSGILSNVATTAFLVDVPAFLTDHPRWREATIAVQA